MARWKPSKEKFVHPLTEWLVREWRRRVQSPETFIDRVDVAGWLGAPTRPQSGVKAYLLVAEDLLAVSRDHDVLREVVKGQFVLVRLKS